MYGGKIRFNKGPYIFCIFPSFSVQNPLIQYKKLKVRHTKRNWRLKLSKFPYFEIWFCKITLHGCFKSDKYWRKIILSPFSEERILGYNAFNWLITITNAICKKKTFWLNLISKAQKKKFSVKDYFAKCEEICLKLRIFSPQ